MPGRDFQVSISARLSGRSSGKLPRIASRLGCWRAASTASSLEFGSHDDGGWMRRGVDARLVHLLEQVVLREGRHLPVRRVRGLAAAPDVHLRVDDQHGSDLLVGALGRNDMGGMIATASDPMIGAPSRLELHILAGAGTRRTGPAPDASTRGPTPHPDACWKSRGGPERPRLGRPPVWSCAAAAARAACPGPRLPAQVLRARDRSRMRLRRFVTNGVEAARAAFPAAPVAPMTVAQLLLPPARETARPRPTPRADRQ